MKVASGHEEFAIHIARLDNGGRVQEPRLTLDLAWAPVCFINDAVDIAFRSRRKDFAQVAQSAARLRRLGVELSGVEIESHRFDGGIGGCILTRMRVLGDQTLQVRVAGDDDLPQMCSLWNAVWPDQLESLSELQRDMKSLPPHLIPKMWIAELDGNAVGYARAYRYIGEYHPRKWNLTVGVEAGFRGKGIGGTINRVAEKYVFEQDPLSIATRVSEDNQIALDYALRLGYREVKRDFESILHLGKLESGAVDSAHLTGVDICCATQFNNPAGRKEWHELFEVVRLDVPRVEPPVRLSLEEFEHYVLDDPEFLWEASFIAVADKKMIGFSGLFNAPAEGLADQWLTAVHRDYRGRKIARALKDAVNQRAIQMGFTRIRTNNDTRNGPMLAVNDRLGYERLPGTITLVRQVAVEEDT